MCDRQHRDGNRNKGSYTTTTGNRLSSDGTWNYTYDDEGNLTNSTVSSGSRCVESVYDKCSFRPNRPPDSGNAKFHGENLAPSIGGSSNTIFVVCRYLVHTNGLREIQ